MERSTITLNPIIDNIVVFVVAFLELYRRSQWLLLRVEHEHLTNRSKFRTLCYVPLLGPAEEKKGTKRSSSGTFLLFQNFEWSADVDNVLSC